MSPADRRDAARLIVSGQDPEVVAAVYPGLNVNDPAFKDLVDMARASAMANERIDRGFIVAQIGALLEPAEGKSVLDAKTKAQLLISLAK